MKNRFYAGFAGAFVVVLFFWLGGFDFDHRGEGAFMCGFLSLAVGCMAAACPAFDDYGKR